MKSGASLDKEALMAKRAKPESGFYTIQQLISRWDVSRTTLHREVKRKRLKPFYVGGCVRFSESEVKRYESRT
jgi:predicted DNA-binding transcriptional regulator AlpA